MVSGLPTGVWNYTLTFVVVFASVVVLLTVVVCGLCTFSATSALHLGLCTYLDGLVGYFGRNWRCCSTFKSLTSRVSSSEDLENIHRGPTSPMPDNVNYELTYVRSLFGV